MEPTAASICVNGSYDEKRVKEAAQQMRKELGAPATCAFVFATIDYTDHLEEFIETLQVDGHVAEIFGCTGRGLIGSAIEQEVGAGFSLLMLNFADTELTVRKFGKNQTDEFTTPEEWKRWAQGKSEVNSWIALLNPLSINVENWLSPWNLAYPHIPCLGGLASSSKQAEGITVFHNHQIVEGGLLIGLAGSVICEALVSQGCRPIGEPFTITEVNRNIIYQLGSKSAFDVLNTVITDLSDVERESAKGNIFVGLATSEYLEEFKQGDFLVRNILGADPKSGGVAIGSLPRTGQTLQYQLRDKSSAQTDRVHVMGEFKNKPKPFASLLFSCIGRGASFFGTADHDAKSLSDHFGIHPSAGFFCNGELGPVAGKNFVHGYTLTAALFRKT